MRRLASLFVSVMLALGTFAWIGLAPATAAKDGGYAPDGEESAFVELLNAYRGELGLAPVTLNSELGAAAEYHSADMATNNYFDHYLFDGTDAGTNIQNFGYTGFPYAENIAAGMETGQEVLTAWQNSPEHNATMTDPQYTEIGIGRAYNEASHYGWYWTATYGAGEGPQTAPDPLPAPIVVTDPSLVTETTPPEAVTTDDGGAVELQQPAINADGDYAASSGANPVADGTGDTYIAGDINTGGIQGQTIVYEEPSLSVSGDAAAPAPAPETTTTTTTTTAPAPVATEPVATDGTFTETTTTDIEMNEGNGRALG